MHTHPDLGVPPTPGHCRDAIHIAVIPMKAAQKLYPGDKVVFANETAKDLVRKSLPKETPIGVVDPFLNTPVVPGGMFWLLLFPKTITSLRHEWTHPDFPVVSPEKASVDDAEKEKALQISRKFITDVAFQMNMSYEDLMAAADQRRQDKFYYYNDDSESYKDIPSTIWEEFWGHYALIRETIVPSGERGEFFSCSC